MNSKPSYTALLLVFVALVLNARPVPILDLDDLTKRADFIIVGRVTVIHEVGRGTIDLEGRKVAARILSAEVRIEKSLKGSSDFSRVALRLSLPEVPVGYQSVPLMRHRLFFLRKVNGVYEPLSPYYPSVVAASGIPSRGATALDRTVSQVGAVLQSPVATAEDKLEAIYVLSRTKSTTAAVALRGALSEKSQVLRLGAAAALLERNDISGLSVAEDALLRPNPALPAYLAHNLTYAISEGVRDEKAIPFLTRLLRAADAKVRRAAASALRRTGSSSAIGPLVAALKDDDFETRYYGVVGLAEITGQSEWRPNMDDFKSEEKRYLNHWMEWARKNKITFKSDVITIHYGRDEKECDNSAIPDQG